DDADARWFAFGTACGPVAACPHAKLAAGKPDENADVDGAPPIIMPPVPARPSVPRSPPRTLPLGPHPQGPPAFPERTARPARLLGIARPHCRGGDFVALVGRLARLDREGESAFS